MRINTFAGLKIVFVICCVLLLCTNIFADKDIKSDNTWIEMNGQVFGAKPDERGPIGGSYGYNKIITEGNYNVKDIHGLLDALKVVKSGEVIFIDKNAEIDCTDLIFTEGFQIKIPSGVILAGDRGNKGSEGAIIRSQHFATNPLINAIGTGVRITGLRIIGPDPKPRLEHHKRAFNQQRGDSAAQSKFYYLFPNSVGIITGNDSLEVDNCELSGWSHAAIYLTGGRGHHVHHNYIHHNQRQGLGYGVCLGYGKNISTIIEYNLFDYNRHSIAGTGVPGSSYEARYNVELGNSLSHNFDMHGGADRKDGTDIAGEQIKIHHNTFLNKNVQSIGIRGVPQKEALIYNNWFAHTQPGKQVILPWPINEGDKISLSNNLFGKENPVVIGGSGQ